MTLREEAIQAYQEERGGQFDEARAKLQTVVGATFINDMEAVHSDFERSYSLVVFSNGDLSFGVRKRRNQDWEVFLTEEGRGRGRGRGGDWTAVSDTLTSLADLGAALVEQR